MNMINEIYLTSKIMKIYPAKEKLHLERAIQHDYFAHHIMETNKGTKL